MPQLLLASEMPHPSLLSASRLRWRQAGQLAMNDPMAVGAKALQVREAGARLAIHVSDGERVVVNFDASVPKRPKALGRNNSGAKLPPAAGSSGKI